MYDESQEDCPICYETIDTSRNIVITPCGHRFCFGCLLEHCFIHHHRFQQPLCPVCRSKINDSRWKRETSNTDNQHIINQRNRITIENIGPILNNLRQLHEINNYLNRSQN